MRAIGDSHACSSDTSGGRAPTSTSPSGLSTGEGGGGAGWGGPGRAGIVGGARAEKVTGAGERRRVEGLRAIEQMHGDAPGAQPIGGLRGPGRAADAPALRLQPRGQRQGRITQSEAEEMRLRHGAAYKR